ncbi:MAG TPA: outer membrane beta-barrel protein [Sphingomicrobium sp.]
MSRRVLMASASLAAVFVSSGALAQAPGTTAAQQPPAAQSSRITTYDAAFFAKYAPRTAYDIVQRIPGFTLDLGANNGGINGGADIRGFAGVAGNVVINGQRPSAKSETLDAYLSRIPANRVKRVEVGPGDLFGADYSSKSQVANLILIEGSGGLSGNATVSGERHYTGVITPNATASASLSRGPSTFNLAGDTAQIDATEEGGDVVYDLPSNNVIERRRKVNDTREHSPFVSASWALDNGPTNSANLNARYHFDHLILHQTNHVFPTDGAPHDDSLVEDYPTKIFELGGDVTRPLAGGAIKFVGLATRQKRHTLDEYDAGNLGHTEITGGFQQLTDSQRNETIGRAVWSKQNLFGFQTEVGGEVALNTLDYHLDFFALEPGGGKTKIDLPIQNARVKEVRGEAWINASRPLTKKLRVDLGLNYETSHLTVTGDATADRKLSFPKPSITLDWQGPDHWHTQLIVRRTVAQLDFFDFISVADLASNQISGGNANLQPQRSWEGRFSMEHPLFGQGKVRLELGYDLVNLLQDRILVFDDQGDAFDAPGNIGTGRRQYADLSFDAPLDRLWKGLRIKLHGNVQRTRVKDPIDGRPRDWSGFWPKWQWDASIRRDIGRFAYGVDISDRARTTIFRTDVIDTRWNGGVYADAFIEYRPTARKTFALNLNNVSDTGGGRNLLLFDPNRANPQPFELDHRFRNNHIRVQLTFKQSFGAAGVAK